jgi:DNA polymerase III sliding clamp (beta) subunit (PCNA family)
MCKLLEGEYPSVYKVLEETYPYNFSIKKNLLNNSLNVSSVITQSDNSPKLEIIINKNQINLIAKSNEFGISNEKIPVEFSNDINQIKFILNLKYLNQMVKIFPDEEIIFNFISNDRQICFTSERNKKYKFLLLPIKQ